MAFSENKFGDRETAPVYLCLLRQLPRQMLTQTEPRPRRSEELTPSEFNQFKVWVAGMPTLIDAAAAISVSRNTLDRLMALGSGKPETIGKIRSVIS